MPVLARRNPTHFWDGWRISRLGHPFHPFHPPVCLLPIRALHRKVLVQPPDLYSSLPPPCLTYTPSSTCAERGKRYHITHSRELLKLCQPAALLSINRIFGANQIPLSTLLHRHPTTPPIAHYLHHHNSTHTIGVRLLHLDMLLLAQY